MGVCGSTTVKGGAAKAGPGKTAVDPVQKEGVKPVSGAVKSEMQLKEEARIAEENKKKEKAEAAGSKSSLPAKPDEGLQNAGTQGSKPNLGQEVKLSTDTKKDENKSKTLEKVPEVEQKKDQAPSKALFLPIGDSEINPQVNPKSITVKVNQEDELAKKRQEVLLEWKKNNAEENVKIANIRDPPIIVTEGVKLVFA